MLKEAIFQQKTERDQLLARNYVSREKISQAKKGQEVGIKVKDKVRDGYKVFKVD